MAERVSNGSLVPSLVPGPTSGENKVAAGSVAGNVTTAMDCSFGGHGPGQDQTNSSIISLDRLHFNYGGSNHNIIITQKNNDVSTKKRTSVDDLGHRGV